MKNIIILFSLFLFIKFTYAQAVKTIKISGKAINFNNSVEVEDMTEFKDISLSSSERIFVPDSNQNFSIQFKIGIPGYYRIGRNIIYISPGDDIKASIDWKNPTKAIFSGSRQIENTYLKLTPFPKAGSFLDGETGIQSSIAKTIDYILIKSKERSRQLDSIQRIVSPEFYQLESIRIKADIINSFMSLPTYYSWVHKISKDSALIIQQQSDSLTRPIIAKLSKGLVDPINLKLVVYRDILKTILQNQPSTFSIPQKINDWFKASAIKQKAITLNNKNDLIALNKGIDSINSGVYKNAILSTIAQLTQLNQGDPAIDILLINTDNQTIPLSNFKNKVIYLEFWATWCGPCLTDKPKMELLKQLFKNDDSIVFLSVSIDDNLDAWKKYLIKQGVSKDEFIVDRNKLSNYNLLSVPRMILINKDFTIEQLYAPSPGDKQLIPLLTKMRLKP
ncbi:MULTISPECIES: TlpA family protein disulfide reductase [unclassified Sediminibacterium]|uniref:TlpA family protein disulfide reductase n=1 Tax=unclassified Sediminibacterium TaxID=2635961 RepID=UPI00041135F6|nr:TlpA disulfide reductase family protein [Sediminibacterium sp. C3]